MTHTLSSTGGHALVVFWKRPNRWNSLETATKRGRQLPISMHFLLCFHTPFLTPSILSSRFQSTKLSFWWPFSTIILHLFPLFYSSTTLNYFKYYIYINQFLFPLFLCSSSFLPKPTQLSWIFSVITYLYLRGCINSKEFWVFVFKISVLLGFFFFVILVYWDCSSDGQLLEFLS